MITKITGFVLLALGLAIILGSLYYSYNIFTGATEVPQIFKLSKSTVAPSSLEQSSDLQNQLEQSLGNAIGEQIKGILPQDSLPTLLNLLTWSMFVGLAILAGSQIANLGIKLIK